MCFGKKTGDLLVKCCSTELSTMRDLLLRLRNSILIHFDLNSHAWLSVPYWTVQHTLVFPGHICWFPLLPLGILGGMLFLRGWPLPPLGTSHSPTPLLLPGTADNSHHKPLLPPGKATATDTSPQCHSGIEENRSPQSTNCASACCRNFRETAL